MSSRVYEKYLLHVAALFSVLLGVTVLVLSLRASSSYPDRVQLTRVDGFVTWTRSARYGVDFQIAGDGRVFRYPHKNGQWQSVAPMLGDASSQPISVWIDAERPRQGQDASPFFEVYAVATPRRMLRSYEQVQESWNADNRLVFVLTPICLLVAGFLEYQARRNWAVGSSSRGTRSKDRDNLGAQPKIDE